MIEGVKKSSLQHEDTPTRLILGEKKELTPEKEFVDLHTGATEGKDKAIEEKFIGGKTGGIDSTLFVPTEEKRQGITEGKSGALFDYEFEKDRVKLSSENDGDIGIKVLRDEFDIVEIAINAKDKDGNPHPDIYPAKLVAKSIEYLEKQGGPLSEIEAQWIGTKSDNLKQYQAYLAKLEKAPEEITKTDREAAAKSTWTYNKVAKPHNFTEIAGLVAEVPTLDGVDVYVRFRRPEQQ